MKLPRLCGALHSRGNLRVPLASPPCPSTPIACVPRRAKDLLLVGNRLLPQEPALHLVDLPPSMNDVPLGLRAVFDAGWQFNGTRARILWSTNPTELARDSPTQPRTLLAPDELPAPNAVQALTMTTFRRRTVGEIADMICGNESDHFPYRK